MITATPQVPAFRRFSDPFTRANAADLGNSWGWLTTSNNNPIQLNTNSARVVYTAMGNTQEGRIRLSPRMATTRIAQSMVWSGYATITGTGNNQGALQIFQVIDNSNHYKAVITDKAASPTDIITKRVAGSFTDIASGTVAAAGTWTFTIDPASATTKQKLLRTTSAAITANDTDLAAMRVLWLDMTMTALTGNLNGGYLSVDDYLAVTL